MIFLQRRFIDRATEVGDERRAAVGHRVVGDGAPQIGLGHGVIGVEDQGGGGSRLHEVAPQHERGVGEDAGLGGGVEHDGGALEVGPKELVPCPLAFLRPKGVANSVSYRGERLLVHRMPLVDPNDGDELPVGKRRGDLTGREVRRDESNGVLDVEPVLEIVRAAPILMAVGGVESSQTVPGRARGEQRQEGPEFGLGRAR